mgnify:CR=1 FL=1
MPANPTANLRPTEVGPMLRPPCSAPTVRRLADAGALACTRVGQDYRFCQEDVERFNRGQRPNAVNEDELYPVVLRLVRRALLTLAKEG